MKRDLAEKGWVPLRYWALWWSIFAAAIVVFYVLLTPVWIGIRIAGWLAARRGPT